MKKTFDALNFFQFSKKWLFLAKSLYLSQNVSKIKIGQVRISYIIRPRNRISKNDMEIYGDGKSIFSSLFKNNR